jgi:hypothetical protein
MTSRNHAFTISSSVKLSCLSCVFTHLCPVVSPLRLLKPIPKSLLAGCADTNEIRNARLALHTERCFRNGHDPCLPAYSALRAFEQHFLQTLKLLTTYLS